MTTPKRAGLIQAPSTAQGRSGRPFTEKVTGAWLRAKSRECESRRSNSVHPAEARSTKDAPKGPVTMMSPSLLNRNHNRNRNHDRSFNLNLEPPSHVSIANHRAPEFQERGTVHRERERRRLFQFSVQILPSGTKSENPARTRKSNSPLHLRREWPLKRGR
jgi:hypothetical protein